MDNLAEQVAQIPHWWHSIDLGAGVATPGYKDPDLLEREWDQLGLGDLRGKSVLDIGTWDGWFAFRASAAVGTRQPKVGHPASSTGTR